MTKVDKAPTKYLMEKTLNIFRANRALEEKGLNQAALADKLQVSREAVSKWFKGDSFPRPDKLLKLGIELELNFSDLVISQKTGNEPVIAFRKKAATKTTEDHMERATDMGWMLERLVEYLPYDDLSSPPSLKQPILEYGYIQKVIRRVRLDIGVSDIANIDFRHLIKKFGELQAVIIPVMWGTKEHHENALHIYLPSSMTTWVYLNLESQIHDFKFWMAHELGHVYAPSLRGEESEDFADAFAQALLFPKECSVNVYYNLLRKSAVGSKVNYIKKIAEEYTISPITVYSAVNDYAQSEGLDQIEIDNIYGAARNFNKQFHTLSDSLFGNETPTAHKYIDITRTIFDSPFFDTLKAYLIDHNKGPNFIQDILDIPLIDAKGIYEELC